MAIVNRSSTQITNVTATTPAVRNDTHNSDGALTSKIGSVANAADDTAASVHRALRLPSSCNVRSVKLSTGDATTAGAIDIGLYYSVDNPADATGAGAVIDADFFASALALTGGPFVKAEQIDESGVYTQAKQEQPLWQAAGLASDPGGYLDLVATITTTYNGASVGQLYEVHYTM